MKRGRFYIVRRNMTSKEINADWVNGYLDQVKTSDGHIIDIDIHNNNGNTMWIATELSTGMQFGCGTTRKLCLKNAQSNADVAYNLISRNDELIAKCKQLINEANEGDIK